MEVSDDFTLGRWYSDTHLLFLLVSTLLDLVTTVVDLLNLLKTMTCGLVSMSVGYGLSAI